MERAQPQPSNTNSVRIPLLLTIAVWTRIVIAAIGMYYWCLELTSPEAAKVIGTVVGGLRNTTYRHWSPEWEFMLFMLMLLPYLLSAIIMIFHKRKGMFCLAFISLATVILDIYAIVDFNLSYSLHGAAMLVFLLNIGVIFATEDYWQQGWSNKKQSMPETKPWYTCKRDIFATLISSALAPFLEASSLIVFPSDKSFGFMPMLLVGFIQACSVSLNHFWRWNIFLMFTATLARVLSRGSLEILDPHYGIYDAFCGTIANASIYCIVILPLTGIIYFYRKKITDDANDSPDLK